MAFGDAGWLVRSLYQFSDLFLVPVLCWFSLRYISGDRPLVRKDLLTVLIGCVTVCSLDLCFISPFLVKLI